MHILSYKKSLHISLIIILVGFTAQQFFITTSVTPIRLYMGIVLVGLLAVSLKLFSHKKVALKFTFIDIALASFYCYMIFTSLYAAQKSIALQMVFGIIFLLCAYSIARIYCFSCGKEQLYVNLVLAAKIFFVLSFIWYIAGITLHYVFGVPLIFENGEAGQVVLFGTYYEGGFVPRFRGICNSPNNFGMYLILFAPILLAHDKKLSKILIFVITISILLTFSMTTYLAIFLIYLTFWIRRVLRSVSHSKFHFNTKKLLKSILFIFIIFFAVVIVINSPIVDSMYDFIEFRSDRIQTGSGRFELWAYTLDQLDHSPLMGQGLNQARVVLLPLRELKSTHNNFLEVLLEGGFIGIFFYLALQASLIYALFSKKVSSKDKKWMIATLIGMFVFSNANVTLYADSAILSIAIMSTVISYSDASKWKKIKFQ